MPPTPPGEGETPSMRRPRTVALFIVVLGCLAFSALVAGSFYRQERRETLAAFTAEVDALAGRFDQELKLHFEALYLLKALFDGSTLVTGEEFQRIASETLQRHGDIRALGWVPMVTGSDTAPSFPLYYLSAGRHRSELLGCDLLGVPTIAPALRAALQHHELRATGPLPLFPGEPQRQGVLVLLPVFDHGLRSSAAGPLRGFIVGYLSLAEILSGLLQQAPLQDVTVTLRDDSAPPSQRLLYGREAGPGAAAYHKALPVIAGRRLSLHAAPSDRYLDRHGSWLPQLIMLCGFLVALLVAAYLRMLIARSAEIEQLVEARTRKLHEANDKLANLSMTDGLTGIANRRNFDSHLEVEWKRSIRERQPLTLMLIDIDCFKAYNDHYGHLQGDRCLRRVARELNEQGSRPRDLVARYGGEEFALILPHTDHAAQALGEQCRAAVEALAIQHAASPVDSRVTVSVGIATHIPQRGSQPTELIARADQALYEAKRKGRNRVVQAA